MRKTIPASIADFENLQVWRLAAIEEGISDADAGKLVTHEDVVAWVRSWGHPMSCQYRRLLS
jgi:predicted transcriptional regulator